VQLAIKTPTCIDMMLTSVWLDDVELTIPGNVTVVLQLGCSQFPVCSLHKRPEQHGLTVHPCQPSCCQSIVLSKQVQTPERQAVPSQQGIEEGEHEN
jgi:hypothetical protein